MRQHNDELLSRITASIKLSKIFAELINSKLKTAIMECLCSSAHTTKDSNW